MDERIKKLRAYNRSLLGHQRILEELSAKRVYAKELLGNLLAAEFQRIESDFPGLVPAFSRDTFVRRLPDGIYFDPEGLRAFISTALGRLQSEIDESVGDSVIERREFTFIQNEELRRIIDRDYGEMQRAFVSNCWKSVIILAGSAIEAILSDLLQRDVAKAKNSGKAPKEADINKWDLVDLINVAVDLKLVSEGIEKLSHPVRQYRNLVHPGNEIRNKLTFGTEEARIALEVVNIVYRDLHK
jgi:hypothetical protein